MRALITNDDGITSPGLHTLATVAVEAGLDVVVAAPSWDSSGASASLSAVLHEGRLLIRSPDDGALAGVEAYCVEAAPAYIVRAAVHGVFGPPPDMVLSGVNYGPNLGHAVLHSGTVGAALTASTYGRRAAAFSLDVPGEPRWGTAGAVAREVVTWLAGRPSPVVLNVNVPDVAEDELPGLREARLAPFGMVQTSITESGEGYVRLSYREVDDVPEPGTDAAWLADGHPCFTALSSVCEASSARTEGLARG